MPQKKQLINLYLNRVSVYPDYVQIHINKVPNNILTPSVKDENGNPDPEGQDLHILLKTAYLQGFEGRYKNNSPARFYKRTGEKVVEARGVEPLSENLSTAFSTSVAYVYTFPPHSPHRQGLCFSSFIIHLSPQSLSADVPH